MATGDFLISRVPVRQRVLLVALVWLVTGYLCFLSLVRRPAERVARLEASVRQLEAALFQARRAEAQLEESHSELLLLRKQVQDFQRTLPSSKETPTLMTRIQELAMENDLNITAFTPGPAERQDFLEGWSIRLTMEGNYHSLATFFEEVEKMNRLVNIEEITVRAIENSSDRKRTIAAACTARTFVRLDETGASAG